VLFFAFMVAIIVFTCSGSSILHSWDSLFNALVVLVIVPSAFPSFFSCHA